VWLPRVKMTRKPRTVHSSSQYNGRSDYLHRMLYGDFAICLTAIHLRHSCVQLYALYIGTKNKITLNITSLSSICVLIMLQPRRQPLMPSCTPPSHVLPLSLSSLSRCDLSQANSCLIVSMCASASCISSLSKLRRFCTHSMLSLLYPKLLGEIPWGAIWTWGDLVSTMMVTCIRIMKATSATASTGPSWLNFMYDVSEPHNSCEVDVVEESLPVLCWWSWIGGMRLLTPDSSCVELAIGTAFSTAFSTLSVAPNWRPALVELEAPFGRLFSCFKRSWP